MRGDPVTVFLGAIRYDGDSLVHFRLRVVSFLVSAGIVDVILDIVLNNAADGKLRLPVIIVALYRDGIPYSNTKPFRRFFRQQDSVFFKLSRYLRFPILEGNELGQPVWLLRDK